MDPAFRFLLEGLGGFALLFLTVIGMLRLTLGPAYPHSDPEEDHAQTDPR